MFDPFSRDSSDVYGLQRGFRVHFKGSTQVALRNCHYAYQSHSFGDQRSATLCSTNPTETTGIMPSSPAVDINGRVKLRDLFMVDDEAVTEAFKGDRDAFVGRSAWLGDALLHTDVSVMLYKLCPEGTKGSLSKMRQTIEANATVQVFLMEATDASDHIPSHLKWNGIPFNRGEHSLFGVPVCRLCRSRLHDWSALRKHVACGPRRP